MNSISSVKNSLTKHKGELRETFKIKEIGVFGSFVKRQQTKKSDIDILVEFEDGYKTFDNYMELKFFLEGILRRKVDLVLKNTVKERLRKAIFNETIYV